jgi:hypothetical protein
MKISKKDFNQMKKKYDDEIRKGGKGQGPSRNVDNQTNWIFFDRKTIEELLQKTDPDKGGIRIYFTEYTEETAQQLYPDNPDDYIGKLNLVISPANAEGTMLTHAGVAEEYYNKGASCPPTCE